MATTAGRTSITTKPDNEGHGGDTAGQETLPGSTCDSSYKRAADQAFREMEVWMEADKRAFADYGYSRSSSLSIARSPDTSSPIYPERAIRPLPKSKLNSKLSPEQRSSIVYPPDPQPMPPPLSFTVQEPGTLVGRQPNGLAHRYQYEEPVHHHHCTCDHDHADSGDEEVEFDHPDYRYSTNGAVVADANGKVRPPDYGQRSPLEASRVPTKPPPPGSAASSADGYESFENTSNKKKRKIPLSSASSMHQSQLSAEMANMGISQGEGGGDGRDVAYGQHYAPMSSPGGTGISGAGRGRYGRQNSRNERRPLGSGSMNTVNFGKRSQGISEPELSSEGSVGLTQSHLPEEVSSMDSTDGIISQAIKTAAEQGPLTPQKGKENISLLQQSASSSTTPKTQFTFSCESESASKMVDQHAAVASYGTPTPGARANGHPAAKGMMATQGTQTTPSLRGGQAGATARPPPPPNTNAPGQPAPPPAPKPKPRRRPSKEYELAARQRKLQQEYQNYHHRPTKDNMWICEFCEYETIFGEPPLALIRAYEIKDRQERKKAAEKRRLLEKAKMKNRKGKKGGKNKNNNNNPATPQNNAAGADDAHYDPNLPPPVDGDEYYDDDEYGDEYDPIGPDDGYPPPPPAPAGTPLEGPGHGPSSSRPPPPPA
ncbi:hypothetical protein MBLNU230_g6908t1 [Neophaeotheca triangularis]